jgi:hypothetical protein
MTWPENSYPVPSLLPWIKVTEEEGRSVFAARRSCSLISAGGFPAGAANFIALSALCSRCVTSRGDRFCRLAQAESHTPSEPCDDRWANQWGGSGDGWFGLTRHSQPAAISIHSRCDDRPADPHRGRSEDRSRWE